MVCMLSSCSVYTKLVSYQINVCITLDKVPDGYVLPWSDKSLDRLAFTNVIPQFAVDHILYSSPPPYITAGVLQKKSPQKSSLSSANWVKYTLKHQD